jgi:hypothetical protein
VQWFCKQDNNDVLINLDAYTRDNKMKACRKLLLKIELDTQRLDISKKKTRNKINQMIKTFKKVRNLAQKIEWEVNISKHDVIVENIREITIREVLIKKCSFYYEFEKIMRDISIITSSYVMKFIQSNLIQINDNSKDEIKTQKIEKSKEDENEIIQEDFLSNTEINHVLKKNQTSKKKEEKMIRTLKRFSRKKTNVFLKRVWQMNFDSDDTSVKSKREKIKSIVDALIEM